MALNCVGKDCVPAYTALSSDISNNKILGADMIGKVVYLEDTGAWKIIKSDLTLGAYVAPPSPTS